MLVALAGAAPLPVPGLPEGWREIAWPFPRDAWPAGRAFRCESASCSLGLEVYVRPKIGFCNCTTGVRDDAEVDAVSDLDMISAEFAPEQDGEPIRVAGLAGRVRAYRITMSDGAVRSGAGYAISSACDLIAVASLSRSTGSAPSQQAELALLGSATVQRWLTARLGGAVP